MVSKSIECVLCLHCLKECGWAIIKKIIALLNNPLTDKQYGFRFSGSTADVLNIVIHRSTKTIDNKQISRAITLDMSKVFDKV